MAHYEVNFRWGRCYDRPLRVIIVGAGIGGLTAGIALRKVGHQVLILEQSSKIAEIGAGIQIAPNAARILGRLNVLDEVLKYAAQPREIISRRYADDEQLGPARHVSSVSKEYRVPLLVIHRGDLQHVLLEAAIREAVDIKTNARVVNVDSNFKARVELASGDWIEGDLLIGADGIHSRVRKQMASYLGAKDEVISTGDSAYRVTLSREKLAQDQEILHHLDGGISTRWPGPGGHIMAYPVRKSQLYNLVFLHPSKPGEINNTDLWVQKGDKQEMMDYYRGWSPTVQRLISYIAPSELMEWPLYLRTPLPHWVVHQVALLGDACHPMLPYVAQGAAQAIEDAGVLAVCLSMTTDVPLGLKVYETVRKTRAETIQNSAHTTRRALHMLDGPEQEKRDLDMKSAGKAGGRNPDLWADQAFQHFMWGVDVMSEAQARFDHVDR